MEEAEIESESSAFESGIQSSSGNESSGNSEKKEKGWLRKKLVFIQSIYPSFEQVRIFFTPGATNFKKLLGGDQPNPPLIPKWPMYFAYPVCIAIITAFYLGAAFFILLLMAAASGGSPRPRYPSSKYKKVVKEGILWDTTYYVERD